MAQTSQNVKWWHNKKKYPKIDFSSFWHDLGFGGNFFLVRIQFKNYLKIDFSSFWRDLAWFWWQLVSIQNLISKSIPKLIFSVFGTILVLVAAFFYSTFY